jgi:hypothetical protein
MEYIQITNWDKWQSYRKDRGHPPWIKIHRRVMRNPEWVSLSDGERGQLVAMWLLAADHNGVIPAPAAVVQKLCFMSETPNLHKFHTLGFLASDGCQDVTPKAEAEENRIEKRKKGMQGEGTKPRKKATRLPEDFAITDPLKKYATERGLNPEQEFEAFKDHHRANTKSLYLDWDATWRTWCRRAVEFGRGNGGKTPPHEGPTPKQGRRCGCGGMLVDSKELEENLCIPCQRKKWPDRFPSPERIRELCKGIGKAMP